MIASMGTPSGSCHLSSIIGHWAAGVQNLLGKKRRHLIQHHSKPYKSLLYKITEIFYAQKWTDLELGWAAGLPCSACQSSTPSQDFILVVLETSPSSPSQKTPPSEVSATLVKIVFLEIVSMAIGLVFIEVPESIHKQLGPMY